MAATLALRAARAGQRVLLCETAGATQAPRLFRKPGQGYTQTELAPRLHTMSITSEAAIEDYVVQQIKFRSLYKMVFRNRVMGPFLDAVPGLHDLIQLGKVWELERLVDGGRRRWDLIVVDAPATGHGLTMLASPRAMMDLTVAGPFHENAKLVAELYEDPVRTAIVLVALPEELPVNETVELYERLGPTRGQVAAVVLNEVHPPPLPDPAFFRERWPALAAAATPAGQEALDLADAALRRAELEARARARLTHLGAPVVELPFLFHRDLGPEDLGRLAEALGGRAA